MSFLRFITILYLTIGFSPFTFADTDPFQSSVIAIPWGGSDSATSSDNEAKTETSFLASTSNYETNKTFRVDLSLTHPEGLHSYYKNPGTVGLPLEVSLKTPEGFEVKGPYWSIPHVGKSAGDFYYGYSKPTFSWYITPSDSAPKEVTLEAIASWQLCGNDGCLPPTDPAAYSLNLTQGTSEENSTKDSPPREVENNQATTGWEFSASPSSDSKSIILSIIPSDGVELSPDNVYFFSDTGEIFPTQTQTLNKATRGYELTLPLNDENNDLYPVSIKTGKLIGMLSLGTPDKPFGVLLDLPLVIKPIPVDTPPLLQLFLALFIGGLILNLMPCVFPVIGLKVMSFVQMGGGQRRKVVVHSLTFVIGVLVSFWAITTLLFLLKQSIPNINWAFWLEQPWVIFTLLILMLVMGLSMFGVFEIGTSVMGIGGKAQQKKGYLGSFYSGVLCTIVATPCTAPFLGASLGPAIALPPALMYVAFTFMGLGMSLPYLILSIFPNLVQKLPKPGAWMESFKQAMSFLLFGTAAWLLWTYWAFYADVDPLLSLVMVFGLIVISIAAWIKGRWMLPFRSKRTRCIAFVLTILLALSGLYISSPIKLQDALEKQQSETATSFTWETWSPEIQEKALSEGRPVYIDFTARWCATCLINKSVAYSDGVIAIIKEQNILMLKADKTTSNPTIDAELKKLGRTAVPVNVLYIPNDPEPKITVPILTAGYLETFLLEHLDK